MNRVSTPVGEMFNHSVSVMTAPSVATFERFERRGTLQNALIYVAIAGGIAGLLGIFGGGIIRNVISTVLGFLIFAYATFYIGRNQGGTGTLDEVAYTFSLFWAPTQILEVILIMVLSLITVLTLGLGALLSPLVLIGPLVYQIYLGHIAVQSSMNVDSGKGWRILIMAGITTLVVKLLVGFVFGV